MKSFGRVYCALGRTVNDQPREPDNYVWGLRGAVVQIYNMINIIPKNFGESDKPHRELWMQRYLKE